MAAATGVINSIWMITREHETETGNGSFYDDYVDEDLGFFTSKEEAEAKLVELQLGEQKSYEQRWRDTTHAQWRSRKRQYEETLANNRILKENGGTPLQLPHLYTEPEMRPWTTGMSAYKTIEIEKGN